MNRVTTIMAVFLAMVPVSSVQAEIIYQSTAAVSSSFGVYPTLQNISGNYELGDEVTLAVTESTTTINNVSFEYYAEIPSEQTRLAVLRVYSRDGADWDIGPKIFRTPGFPLYESQPITLTAGSFTLSVPVPNLTVPSTMIWAVEFRGFTQTNGDKAALILTDTATPSIGSSFNDYWSNAGSTGWALLNSPPRVANFAASVSR
jgi:hypothetical protein